MVAEKCSAHGGHLFNPFGFTSAISSRLPSSLPLYAPPPSLSLSLPLSPSVPPSQSLSVCLLVGCLTSQLHASVSQGRICTDNFTCCHTDIEVADPTFYFAQSQNTNTVPTSPSADPIMPGAWQGSHWSANF